MPSTYSTNLRLELMADGEKSGTWGTITNSNLGTLLEQAVTGVASVTHDDSASYTLTTNNGSTDEARNAVVLMTGTLTAAREVIVPDVDKVYIFKNGTSGGYDLTFKTSGGSGVTIPNGRAAIVYVDASTGAVNAIDDGYFTDSIFIEGTGTGNFITAESTNAGSASGPDMKMYRNSASPADGDAISKIVFHANTDDGAGGVSVADVEYANIAVTAPETNETTGEAGKLTISLKRGGTTQSYIEIQGGTNSDSDNDSIIFKTGGTAAITIDNSQDVTFSGAISGTTATFTTSDNDPQLILKSTDADANDGPILDLIRDSASPADNDAIGSIRWRADDSGGTETQYADIRVFTNDVTDGTEDGQFNLRTMLNGSLRLRIKADPTEIVFNEESQDLDFRVESNSNANMLFVDAGSDHVNIGTSTDFGGALNVNGGLNSKQAVFSSTNNRGLALLTATRGGQNDGVGIVDAQDTEGTGGRLELHTAGAERARFESSGIVFNDSGADSDFRVEGTTQSYLFFTDAGNDRIGVNESSPLSDLHIKHKSDIGTGQSSGLGLESGTGSQMYLLQCGLTGQSNSWFNLRDRTNSRNILSADETAGKIYIWNDFTTYGATVFNEGGNDKDFRVESDGNTHMLFVDAGNNKVGIAESSPVALLDVGGAQSDNSLMLRSGDNNTAASGGKQILFGYNNTSSYIHNIRTRHDSSNQTNNTISFYTWQPTQAAGDIGNAKIAEFSSSGVVFNEDSRDADFRVESDSNDHMLFVDASANRVGVGSSTTSRTFNVYLNDSTAYSTSSFESTALGCYTRNTDTTVGSYAGIQFAVGTNSDAAIAGVRTADANCAITFGTRGTGSGAIIERMRIGSTGGITAASPVGAAALFQAENTSNTSGDFNIVTLLGSNAINTSSYQIICGQSAGSDKLYVYGNGNVVNVNNSYGSLSDEKLKENIVDSGSQWDDIKALRVRKYSMKEENLDAPNMLGVIAQEVEAAGMGGLVFESPDRQNEGETVKQVNYSVLYMKAVKALQEAMERIETLEARITALEAN